MRKSRIWKRLAKQGWTIERFMVVNMLGQAFVCSFACSFCSLIHSSMCFISFHFVLFYLRSFVRVSEWVCYVDAMSLSFVWSENAAVSYDRNEKFVIQLNTHKHTRIVWLLSAEQKKSGWRKDKVKYEISLAFKITKMKNELCAMSTRSTWHFHGLCVSKSHKEVCLL